jgi:hypothetical protein
VQEEAVKRASRAYKQKRLFQHSITLDEEHKSVTLQSDDADNANLKELHIMMDNLVRDYFKKKEYTVIIPIL